MQKKLADIALRFVTTLGLLVAVFPAQLAQASISPEPKIIVCNSSGGYTEILVKYNGQPADAWTGWPGGTNDGYLYPYGRCSSPIPNGSNQVRVDTDPTGLSHSYKMKPDGGSYGPCHTNSDNHNSDPTNVAKIWYRNYDHGDCTD